MNIRESGHLLSRRQVVSLLGATGVFWLIGGALFSRQASASSDVPSCVVRPEQTEGPYFVDEGLNRSDIRTDPTTGQVKAGTALTLTLQIFRVGSRDCAPLAGAHVDIWHCDALGVYSDVRDAGFNTIGQKFLRGYQISDARGEAKFVTIYPGWYAGRTVHIHVKVRTAFSGRAEPRIHVANVLRRRADRSRICRSTLFRKRPAHRTKSG